MSKSVTERLGDIISNYELPDEVVMELVYIIEDLDMVTFEDSVSVDSNQMRIEYDY